MKKFALLIFISIMMLSGCSNDKKKKYVVEEDLNMFMKMVHNPNYNDIISLMEEAEKKELGEAHYNSNDAYYDGDSGEISFSFYIESKEKDHERQKEQEEDKALLRKHHELQGYIDGNSDSPSTLHVLYTIKNNQKVIDEIIYFPNSYSDMPMVKYNVADKTMNGEPVSDDEFDVRLIDLANKTNTNQ